MDAGEPTLERLEDQIHWHDRKSAESQHRFKLLKRIQQLAAATIRVVATVGLHPAVRPGSGARSSSSNAACS